ncbi:MAG: hypothetical protein KF760_02195 [Candidatus Eremiobacteraeota bacterium]|nr:hypothetical protein [Candidatus Eremiobacteraeota bacterium]MCW5871174.1 hypothetical protein [Candidatus Eremiobacteraeota bacterium]
MSHDYRGFQDKIGADMATASAAAAGMDRGAKGSKLRIRQSDLETLIPSGALVEFVPSTGHKLKFGDIVLIRNGSEFSLRRFVGFQIVKGGAKVSVARANPPKLEIYPDTSIVGKVTKVEAKGVSYDPLKKESQLVKWRNEWTFFGTSSMFSRIGHNLKIFGKMMKKK